VNEGLGYRFLFEVSHISSAWSITGPDTDISLLLTTHGAGNVFCAIQL
jgi:hypothetical protein